MQEESKKPVPRTHSKKRVVLLSLFATFVLGGLICGGLFLFWPRETKPAVNGPGAPTIETSSSIVQVCPNGKILPFDYKVLDEADGDLTSKAEIELGFSGVFVSATDSEENKAEKVLLAQVKDDTPPTIELNGDTDYSVLVGTEFALPKPTATDDCDGEIAIKTTGTYDVNAAGHYVINHEATDTSGNITTATQTVNVTTNSGVIYLTFDDGPGADTGRLLDILKAYNVKATFFVTNRGDDSLILREYNEGHAVGLHSATHDYAYIYSSVDNYFADLTAVQQRVKNITGYTSHLLRFPGGSSNTVSRNYDGGTRIMSTLTSMVKEKGFTYFDWNLSSGDAGSVYTADAVYWNVVNRLQPNRDWVILQHDIKGFSVDAVERIIQYGKAQGFTFKKLDESSFTAAHGVLN